MASTGCHAERAPAGVAPAVEGCALRPEEAGSAPPQRAVARAQRQGRLRRAIERFVRCARGDVLPEQGRDG